MTTKVKIRRADAYDVVRITRLLEKGAAEQAESIWYSKPSKSVARRIGHVLTVIDRGVVIVAEAITEEEGKPTDRKIVGAIGMIFGQDGWSDDWLMNNEWFYVHKDWRAEQVAANLLTAVETFADTFKGANGKEVRFPIVLGVLSGTDTALKDEMMSRRGWTPAGSNFVRQPTPIEADPSLDDGESLRGE